MSFMTRLKADFKRITTKEGHAEIERKMKYKKDWKLAFQRSTTYRGDLPKLKKKLQREVIKESMARVEAEMDALKAEMAQRKSEGLPFDEAERGLAIWEGHLEGLRHKY